MIQDYSLGKDSSVPLMHHDPSDLGSLVLVKKRKESENVLTFSFFVVFTVLSETTVVSNMGFFSIISM